MIVFLVLIFAFGIGLCRSCANLFLVGLKIADHKAGKHCHNHLGLDFHNVVWQGVHAGSNLARQRDGILGIV